MKSLLHARGAVSVAALAGGVLSVAGFAPVGAAPLAFATLTGLLLLWRRATAPRDRQAFQNLGYENEERDHEGGEKLSDRRRENRRQNYVRRVCKRRMRRPEAARASTCTQ